MHISVVLRDYVILGGVLLCVVLFISFADEETYSTFPFISSASYKLDTILF